MSLLTVTAIGADRPGIVATVTGALVDRGCNLEDTSMSILRGHFAMVLLVAAPEGLEPSTLEADLDAVVARSGLDLDVAVRAVAETDASAGPSGEVWTVVVYGADRPGIVHRVSSALSALDVNIADLSTRMSGQDGQPVYSMVMEVESPAGLAGVDLAAALRDVAADLGVECTLHPAEADIL